MVRQYIGARYVTKIYENSLDPSSAEWEAGVTYEPLTLVTYLNSSYLSKKDVPGAIGDPASNPSYWVVTGAYNGQILQLQNDVSALQNAPDFRMDLANRKIMFIMDSYGGITTTGGENLAEAVETITGAECDLIYQPGAGMVNGAFNTLVSGYSGDVDHNTIVIIGGANDQTQTASAIRSAIATLITTIRSKFVDAKDIFIMCPGLTFSTQQPPNANVISRDTLWQAYRNGAIDNNCIYIENSQYIFRNTELLDTDFCHPVAAGMDNLLNFTIEGLVNGVVNVHYELQGTLTLPDSTTRTYRMVRNNGNTTLTVRGGLPQIVKLATVSDTAGVNYVTFGTFNKSLIDNCDNNGNFDMGALGTYYDGGNMYDCCAELVIEELVFKGFVQKLDSAAPSSGTGLVLYGNGLTIAN